MWALGNRLGAEGAAAAVADQLGKLVHLTRLNLHSTWHGGVVCVSRACRVRVAHIRAYVCRLQENTRQSAHISMDVGKDSPPRHARLFHINCRNTGDKMCVYDLATVGTDVGRSLVQPQS